MSRDRDLLFEDLVHRHTDIAFHVARSWSGNEADAEELCQIAFVKAYRAFDRFQPGTNFKAWLLKILRNSFIDWTRKQGRRKDIVSLDKVSGGLEATQDVTPPQAVNMENREVFYELFGSEVARLLREVPEHYQLPVLLCDVEGLSYLEIAAALEIPLGTVRSRVHRGRAMLQRLLRNYAEKVGYLKGVSR